MQRLFLNHPSLVLTVILTLVSFKVLAIDSSKCSKMLNNGWLKKYEYAGIGESNANAITRATKSKGTTAAYSDVTTEGSTVISDPGYTTNTSKSQTQSTSSWGDCSAFAKIKMQEYQEKYIDQNQAQILKQISIGSGEHLEMLAYFNICEDKVFKNFGESLQKNYLDISAEQGARDMVKEIKSVLKSDKNLQKSCYSDFISG